MTGTLAKYPSFTLISDFYTIDKTIATKILSLTGLHG